jgi:hypothetical protein
MSDCYPWWHQVYAPLAAQAWTGTIIPSGCGAANPLTGDIGCSPETMRSRAEAWLAQHYPQALAQIGGFIPLDVYTYARYMHSEVGDGTLEERVAVGEAGINRAKRARRSISQLLMPSGYYGPIHAPESTCIAKGYARGSRQNRCPTSNMNTCCSPFGRWAATSRDPSIMALLLAHLVVSGESGNFSNGADDQDGPEIWISKGQTALTNYVKGLADNGKFWVGPLPGVDHWRTFLQFTPDFVQRAREGKALLQRGIDALALPAQRPYWPADLPICSKPGAIQEFIQKSNGGAFLLASLGLAVGTGLASLVAKRYLHPR